MKNLLLAACLTSVASSASAASNQDHCTAAIAADKMDGATMEQCLCAYSQADAHLTPEMKQIMMKSHLTGENPMTEMMTLDELENLMPKMMAYGEAVEKECGL